MRISGKRYRPIMSKRLCPVARLTLLNRQHKVTVTVASLNVNIIESNHFFRLNNFATEALSRALLHAYTKCNTLSRIVDELVTGLEYFRRAYNPQGKAQKPITVAII